MQRTDADAPDRLPQKQVGRRRRGVGIAGSVGRRARWVGAQAALTKTIRRSPIFFGRKKSPSNEEPIIDRKNLFQNIMLTRLPTFIYAAMFR